MRENDSTGVNRVLVPADTYEAVRDGFSWDLPERFNIGVDICDNWADREPERLALIHKRDDGTIERYSYRDLKNASNQLANVLANRGIGPGDRVALLLPQTPLTAIAHIAIYKLGAVVLPLAVLFGVDGLKYRLGNSGAKAVITARESLVKIAAIKHDLADLDSVFCIDGRAPDAIDLRWEMTRESADFSARDTAAEDPAVMVYTSGTTGPPKGALHAHRVLIGHFPCVEFTHEFFPQADDVMWTPSDWAWAGGLFNILLPSLHYGVPVVARKITKFDPEAAFALMAETGVRNSFIPPTALKIMRATSDVAARFDLKTRTLGSGGEALGRELVGWGRDVLGITINEFYGQTECNAVLSSCSALGVTRPGAIGRPVPGHDVRIIDSQGNVLSPGETGIIAVRSPDPVIYLEYWNNPEATRDKMIGEWLTTGDQGMVDDDGYIRFVGRDDDVITSAGYRIGPGEIEDCLIGHDAVALAAVVGKPDPVRTEIVKAFIVLNEGYEPGDELATEIRAHVRERLSAHEYPREITFVDSLPLTTTGKIIRRQLRELG